MASVSLNLDISASGLKGLVELSSQFNKNMQAGATAASGTSGGTAGSRALSSSSPSASSYVASKAENQGYNLQRAGSSTGTGSATSDFARQAQGLGGLVHVYATFAANIFAAEAAFSALSNAMNTSHLAQGLDQLSAQSGKSLGNLSKQLNAATDGALSMKAAMTSTANASAAGMTNDQILKMGEVAKKASQALGWDMADAMDRLTKGISKNRPQLLDELGIIVNANTIYSDYAKSVGKTTASLTDYEKKQAFANAVLKQGLDKFSAIDIPTNPYTKLTASMEDMAQKGLTLVNSILGPIVSMLSSSPTGLAVAMGLVASTLLKQALPALGAFKESAQASAEVAQNLANQKNDIVKQSLAKELNLQLAATQVKNNTLKKQMDIEITASRAHYDDLVQLQVAKTDAAQQAVADIRDKAFKKGSAAARIMAINDPSNVTPADYATLQRQADRFTKSGDIAKAAPYLAGIQAFKDWTSAEQAFIANDDKLKAEKLAHDAELTKAYDEQIAKNKEVLDTKKSNWSIEGRLQAEADRANLQSITRNIASQASQTASTKGFFAAMKEARASITSAMAGPTITEDGTTIPKMNALRGAWTGISSGIGAATTAISGFLNFAGPWMQVIGLAVAAFAALDSYMTSSAKQIEAYSTANTALEGSLTTVANTLEAISKKDISKVISVESVQAKANALDGLTTSFANVLDTFDKLKSAQDAWDKFFDGLWGIVGKGSTDKLAAGMSNTVVSAIKVMTNGRAKTETTIAIQNLLGQKVDLTNFKSLNDAISKIDSTKLSSIGAQLEVLLKTASTGANNAAAALTGFKAALSDIEKQSTLMSNALVPTDNFSKLGIDVGKAGKLMSEAMQDPVNSLVALKELINDTRTLSLLPPETAIKLVQAKDQMDKLTASIAAREEEIVKSNKLIDQFKGTAAVSKEVATISPITSMPTEAVSVGATKMVQDEQKRLEIAEKRMKEDIQASETIRDNFKAVPTMLNTIQYEYLTKGLNTALQEASISSAKSYLNILKDAGLNTAQAEGGLAKAAINVQMKVIEANFSLIESQKSLEIRIEALALSTDRNNILKELETAKSGAKMEALIVQLATNSRSLETVKLKGSMVGMSASAILKVGTTKGDNSPEAVKAAQDMQTYATALLGKTAQLAKLKADMYGVDVTTGTAVQNELTKNIQEQIKLKQDSNSLELLSINNLQAQVGGYSKVLETRKESNLIDKANNDHLQIIIPLLREQVKLSNITSPKDKADYTQKVLDNTLSINEETNKWQDTVTGIQNSFSIGTSIQTQKELADKVALTVALMDNANKIQAAKIGLQEQELSNAIALNKLDDITYANSKADLDTQKQAAIYAKDAYAAQAAIDAAKESQKTIQTRVGTGTDIGREELKLAQDKVDLAINNKLVLDSVNDSTNKGIGLTKAQSVELALQKNHLESIAAVGVSLTTIFGAVGAEIGSLVTAMDSFAKTSLDGVDKVASAQKDYIDLQISGKGTTDSLAAAEKNVSTVRTKATAQDMEGISSIAGATKKMFTEKSAGYALLAAVEKTSAAASLALNLGLASEKIGLWYTAAAAQMGAAVVGELGATAAAEAGFLTRLPIYIKSIYASWGAMGPWMVGAAAAFIAAELGGSGGGASAPPIDQGTLAGTGQQVGADGQSIGTRAGGVIGDSKATAKSITDSITELSKVFFNTMGSSSSNLLKHLQGIQDNTYNTAKALGAAGVIGGSNPFGASLSSSKAFSTGVGLLDNVLGSIFGGSSSQSVTGAGIQVGGTSTQLAGGGGNVQGYTNVHSETSGGWFSGSTSSDSTQYSQLDKSITQGIQGIFKNFNSVLLDTAGSLGQTKDNIQNILDSTVLSLKVSNVGLTGTEFAAKLSAEVSVQLNAIAEQAYPFLSLYTKVGEESFQVATRLIKDGETVTYGLNMVGKSISVLGETSAQMVADQQTVISNFGGTSDLFAAAMQSYYDALFTDSEKAAQATSSVQKQLSDLGITGITTNDQLKALIASTDPLSQTYADLVKIAPVFVDATAQVAKLADTLAGSRLDQTVTILGLLNDTEGALALTRKKELAALDPALVANQKYIYALQDEATIKAQLVTAYNTQTTAINATITSLKTSVKTMTDYKTAMMQGANSILDPNQKYQAAQQTLTGLEALISGPATTDAQKAAQADAISKFPSASDAFLNASKVLFSSSAQYTQDFQTVADFVDTSAAALASQQTDAQQQLQVLTDSYTALGIISTATTDTVTLLSSYLAAQAATGAAAGATTLTPIPAHANGGMAYGVSLVGEKGPELVDFSTPSRVYSNQNSKGMFNTDEMVAELKALREEVSQLRKDQKDQTGHIITTNYDANIKAATMVAGATEDAASLSAWNSRVVPTLL